MNGQPDEVLEKLRSRGYWRINFRPLVLKELKPLSRCKDVVRKNTVLLRGWDYPHFPERTGEDADIRPGPSCYQAWIDWGVSKEFWRMYQSGQFLHYLALRTDWYDEETFEGEIVKGIPSGAVLGIADTVYQMTEVYEFLSRLTREGIYEEGIDVGIALRNTSGRELRALEPGRLQFPVGRKTGSDTIQFPSSGYRRYSKDEAISRPAELAREAIYHFFEYFEWENPSQEMVKKEQDNLLSKRL